MSRIRKLVIMAREDLAQGFNLDLDGHPRLSRSGGGGDTFSRPLNPSGSPLLPATHRLAGWSITASEEAFAAEVCRMAEHQVNDPTAGKVAVYVLGDPRWPTLVEMLADETRKPEALQICEELPLPL